MSWNVPLDQITWIHFDLNNICNLACPECGRTKFNNLITEKKYLDFNKFSEWFKKEELKNLKEISFIGSFGEPVSHPQIIEIIEYFHDWDTIVQIDIATNGSLKSTKFWESLAKYQKLRVIFGIDGLEDTNKIYRVNSNWKLIEKNYRAFIKAGGTAIWQFILFSWNKHQLDDIKKKSKEEGFLKMYIINSHRGTKNVNH